MNMTRSICILSFLLLVVFGSMAQEGSPIGALEDNIMAGLIDDGSSSGGILDENPIMSLLPDDPGSGLLGEDPMDTDAPSPGPSIPVDGGLSLLLAAGAAYGVRRLRRRGGDSSTKFRADH